MKKITNFSLRKLLYNKKIVTVFSIVIAFVIWLSVVMGQTPTIERTITGIPVVIDTAGTMAAQLGLQEVSGAGNTTVKIKVSGPAYVVSGLDAEDIQVKAVLPEIRQSGTYNNVELAAVKGGGDYSVISITPATLNLKFDTVVTLTYDNNDDDLAHNIDISAPGISAETNYERGTPATRDIVTITGPNEEISKIARVEARISDKEVLKISKTYTTKIVLYSADGTELDKTPYSISNETVEVSVPILKSKMVDVVANFTNAPSGSADFLKYSLSVKRVTLKGPAETVDKIYNLALASLDFSKISLKSNSFDMSFTLPSGVEIQENIEAVTLKIDTSNLAEKTYTVSNISLINNANNYKVSLNGSIKNVKMCGIKSQISALKADNLYAEVDLTDIPTGNHTVTVAIKASNGSTVWQVGSYQASITVK